MGSVVVAQGVLLALAGLTAFGYMLRQDGDVGQARTMAFCVVVYGELF